MNNKSLFPKFSELKEIFKHLQTFLKLDWVRNLSPINKLIFWIIVFFVYLYLAYPFPFDSLFKLLFDFGPLVFFFTAGITGFFYLYIGQKFHQWYERKKLLNASPLTLSIIYVILYFYILSPIIIPLLINL